MPGEPVWCREVDILLACTATRLPPTPGINDWGGGGGGGGGGGLEKGERNIYVETP